VVRKEGRVQQYIIARPIMKERGKDIGQTISTYWLGKTIEKVGKKNVEKKLPKTWWSNFFLSQGARTECG